MSTLRTTLPRQPYRPWQASVLAPGATERLSLRPDRPTDVGLVVAVLVASLPFLLLTCAYLLR